MASPAGFGANGSGLMFNPFQAYFGSLESMTQNMGPLKGLARAQLEWTSLLSRRAQAYMEIPSRMARCRTPQDLMSEQMRFWQTAFQQYSESSHRIMQAWGQAATAPIAMATAGSSPGRSRDYIEFADPKAANGSGALRSPRQVA